MGGVSVAGLRPGFGRGGTIHSLLVREIGGEVAPGEDTAERGNGFIQSEGGLTACMLVECMPSVDAVISAIV